MTSRPAELARQLTEAHGTVADLVPGQDALVVVRMSVVAEIVEHLNRLAEMEANDGRL